MKFVIRKAEEKDLNSISAIYEKKDDYPLSPFGKAKRENFCDMSRDRTRCILVGEKNGVIDAFLSMKIEWRFENAFKPSAIILDLKSKNCETEIVCAILSRAIAVAMENGCCEIMLADKNVNAATHSVYSICGFRESETHFIKKL